MRAVRLLLILTVFLLSLGLAQASERNPDWAVSLDVPGVGNLHKVTDTLYRSAQPDATGMKSLEWVGIRTVINLRGFHSDTDKLKGTGLIGRSVSMHAWNVDSDDIVRVLRLLRDPEGAPYLVHCQHGADRTGIVIAFYRIIVEGWSKEAAIDEMKNGGYGFHTVWKNIVEHIEKADIEAIRAKVMAP